MAISPSPSRSISPLDTAKPLELLLLHHFASEASLITSCHPSIQADFCQLLVPMAFSYPPLLSALMALSAIHRSTLYSSSISTPIAANETTSIISLKSSSISKLRNELDSHHSQLSTSATREAALATALTLCMCEIHSGADQPRSWRLHLEGAKAILSSSPENEESLNSVLDVSGNPTSQSALLERWFISIEALAAITAKGLKRAQSFGNDDTEMEIDVTGKEKEVYLDDYFGFSTDLAQTFKAIGAAAWERRSLNASKSNPNFSFALNPSSSSSSTSPVTSLSEGDLEFEAANLEISVRMMLARDEASPPMFYAGVREKLDEIAVHEFYLCNEMYQHSALIHIYRRVRCLPRAHQLVQTSVQRILECVRGIQPRGGLSPYIVLTMPLFTAGRELLPDDLAGREEVRFRLTELADKLKLRNVWRGLEFLEMEWGNGESIEGMYQLLHGITAADDTDHPCRWRGL